MDISFIILTYNSRKYIEACINSYANSLKKEGLKAEFIIADNGSKDGTLDIIENKIRPNLLGSFSITVIKYKNNFGTTLTRNAALKVSKGTHIVICDSDTEYKEGNWEDLLKFLNKDPTIGIVAPYLCGEDGNVQITVKLFPTLTDKLLKLGKIFFNIQSDMNDFYKDFPWTVEREVDTAVSAFWLFNRKLIQEVGYLDEKIFYSPEDVDYCLRVWEGRKKVVFYPWFRIIHRSQQISHKKPFNYLACLHFVGLLYFFCKHKYLISRNKLYLRLRI